ncbi:MAG: 3-keto-5-aminohexanoate cleavage protein [Thermomicrobiales bacterium]
MSTSTSTQQSRAPLIQAALNGRTTRTDHPAAPMTVEDFVRDAGAVAAAGAGAIHLHPRDAAGRETVDPVTVDDLVSRMKAASGLPVGVTTGDWIEPDLELRLAAIRGWTAPDYASVNLSEHGATRVMDALLTAGVGIEAGLATVEDVTILVASGLAARITRILVEPFAAEHDNDVAAILATAHAIHAALDRARIAAPRLQHSDGPAAWPLLRDALAHGRETRIGLEDTLVTEDGKRADGNASLVACAIGIRTVGH